MNSQFDGDDFKITLDQNPVLDSERAKQQRLTRPEQIPPPSPLNKHSQPSEFIPMSNDYNLSNAAHPFACIATCAFKLVALVTYLFIGILIPSVLTFILVTILAALDFWTVKNVTGRLLVGLRWWSDFDQKGEQIWKFQSHDRQINGNPVDKAFFWTAQIVSTLFWGILVVINFLSFSPFWAMLVIISFFSSAVNLYGYYKCRGDHSKKLKKLQSQGLRRIAGRIF